MSALPGGRARLAPLVGLALLGVSSCSAQTDGAARGGGLAASPDTGSVACMPVDARGVASFAWETIENTSEGAVTVTDVTLSRPDTEVVEWFLVPESWEEAGASRGTLADPGDAELGHELEPGSRALVAVSVRLLSARASTPERPVVDFSGEDPSELTLGWGIQLLPPGEDCASSR